MDPTENLPEDDDLTVLEFVRDWIHAQFNVKEKSTSEIFDQVQISENRPGVKPVFWIGLILTIIGQILLGLQKQSLPLAGLLAIAFGMGCVWFGLPNENLKADLGLEDSAGIKFHLKPIWLLAALAMMVVCFWVFTENRFGWLQTLSWLTAIVCGLYAFWPARDAEQKAQKLNWKLWQGWRRDWLFFVLVVLVAVLGLIFRLKDLAGVPPEMISAQVETYYSVSEIRQGGNYILFSRNSVPEPLNYYWANLVNLFSGQVLKMGTLRLANALAGLIGIGFIFGLGQQIANRWVGLVASGLAGMSFWLVLQERAAIGGGLVFPLMAGALLGLVKGLDEQDARFFLLSAVTVGLGLMSNKIFLIFPLVALVVILGWKNRKSFKVSQLLGLLGVGLLISVITALPLLRAISLEPMSYFAPILARIGEYEVSYTGSPVFIFFGNFVKAIGIANWTNQGSWVDSIANRGAVDGITAFFFLIGIVSLVKRYRISRDWKLLISLLLYPILLLPSVLALAFPSENPSMTRAIGAAIPVLLIAAYGIVEVLKVIRTALRQKSLAALAIAGVLIFGPIVVSNNNLVFRQFPAQYKTSAWNASEMAEVITRFYASGREGLSYLISYPYWVDSRAVAISMGRPEQNLSLPATEIANTLNVSLSKLFILNPLDKNSIAELQAAYPEGVISTYQSTNPDKNFILFIVGQRSNELSN